jgi:hypothetical protein
MELKTKYVQPKGIWGKERKVVDTDKVNSLWLEGYSHSEIPMLLGITRMHIWRYRKVRGGTNNRTLADRITHLTNREKLKYEGKIPLKSNE